jgi:hypothetical protein
MGKKKAPQTYQEYAAMRDNERYACIRIDVRAATVLEILPLKWKEEPDKDGEAVENPGVTVAEMRQRLDGLNTQAINAALRSLEGHGLIEVVYKTWRGIEQTSYPLVWRRTQAGTLAVIATDIHEERDLLERTEYMMRRRRVDE